MTVITLIGKPGCHLCEDARRVVDEVVASLDDPARVAIEERSILDDKALHDRYWDEIPVVLIDGEVHTFWRVDPDRLRSALA